MNDSADHLFDNIKFDIDGRTIDPEKDMLDEYKSSTIRE
uniref:Conserved domain protein n=1 Tax=Heterorhabditis bacteriophora TaxID=37862 RepID=A0A1I7W8X6_HETBA